MGGASGDSIASDASVRSSRKESEATSVTTSGPVDPSGSTPAAERTARRARGTDQSGLRSGERKRLLQTWRFGSVLDPSLGPSTEPVGWTLLGARGLSDVTRDIDAQHAFGRVVGARWLDARDATFGEPVGQRTDNVAGDDRTGQ